MCSSDLSSAANRRVEKVEKQQLLSAKEMRAFLLEMFTNGITFITARASSRPVIPDILAAVVEGRIHPERITSRVVPWDDAIDALLELPTKLVMERS